MDGGSPKVSPAEVAKLLERNGFEVSQESGEIAIVVGGDGKFGRYGRTESIPLLFVGMRSKRRTGSRAYLAEVHFDELPRALEAIEGGKYHIEEHQRLAVAKNGEDLGEVFTDVYLQRGAESTCLRYRLAARGEGVDFEESAIGDGVVVTTSAGSTGFYSYPDRIRRNAINPRAFTKISKESIGICHIIPTYTERIGTTKHPLRYELPWGCSIVLSLFRRADARLYGTSGDRRGERIGLGDEVTIGPGRGATKLVKLSEDV